MISEQNNAASARQVGDDVKRFTTMKDFAILMKIGDGAYSEVYKVKRYSD